MNALFVDDELDVLDGIVNEIEFEKIGIDNVYTAVTAVKAREILSTIPIDILVTDIEMPEMTGLELLDWAHKNKLSMVSIFCTAYSDFNYARKAIQLKAFDYFLKPIFYQDLQEKLQAAVVEAKRRHEREHNEQNSRHWESIQEHVRNSFWKNLVENPTQPGAERIMRLMDEHKLAYTKQDRFVTLAVDLAPVEQNEAASELAMAKLKDGLAARHIATEALFIAEPGILYIVLRQQQLSAADVAPLCRSMIEWIHIRQGLNIYYLSAVACEQVYAAFQQIRDIFRVEPAAQNKVYNASETKPAQVVYQNEQLPRWEQMLCLNQTAAVIDEAEAFLKQLASTKQISRQMLMSFRADLIQLIYTVLQKNQIVFRELLLSAEYNAYHDASVASLTQMMGFIRYLLTRAQQMVDHARQADTAIGTAVQYIHNHLSERITRETLASQVYLNPDYFARVFRQSEGMSIGSYLKKCRMEEAQRLLATSNHTIGTIAYEVGFDNFSYFSQMFRKTTGCSPKEYRMAHRKQES